MSGQDIRKFMNLMESSTIERISLQDEYNRDIAPIFETMFEQALNKELNEGVVTDLLTKSKEEYNAAKEKIVAFAKKNGGDKAKELMQDNLAKLLDSKMAGPFNKALQAGQVKAEEFDKKFAELQGQLKEKMSGSKLGNKVLGGIEKLSDVSDKHPIWTGAVISLLTLASGFAAMPFGPAIVGGVLKALLSAIKGKKPSEIGFDAVKASVLSGIMSLFWAYGLGVGDAEAAPVIQDATGFGQDQLNAGTGEQVITTKGGADTTKFMNQQNSGQVGQPKMWNAQQPQGTGQSFNKFNGNMIKQNIGNKGF